MRLASAIRCTTALVEPPIAAFVRIAFSKAWRVRILSIVRSSRTMSTMRRPARCASTCRRASTARIAALCGKLMPSDSTIEAIVEAVPIVMQWPRERFMHDSASVNSSCVIVPARTSSDICQTPVPEPIFLPRKRPLSIGPPDTASAGRLHDAAPISSAGVVLSQPTSRITPSIGLPRIDSSTSIEARLRNSIAVGRRFDSPSDMTGNSSGKPPASCTPFFTYSASSRKCALHGVSSDHVLQMPITGRPSNSSCGIPWFFIHER
ncbi:hypothetical protein AWB81_08454 [Caballeronia arationis]|nr:hypothetical protein AWB81_08454 [Caballeronia arationis]